MAGTSGLDVRAFPNANMIHIVLDAFQSDVFSEILAEERPGARPQPLRRRILRESHRRVSDDDGQHSGDAHWNGLSQRSAATAIRARASLKEASIFKSLRAQRLSRRCIAGMCHGSESATNYFRLRRPYVSYDEYIQFAALAACRSVAVPARAAHPAGRPFTTTSRGGFKRCSAQATRARAGTTGQRRRRPRRVCEAPETATDEPVYKFIHVGIPHRPVASTANCDFIGVNARDARGL